LRARPSRTLLLDELFGRRRHGELPRFGAISPGMGAAEEYSGCRCLPNSLCDVGALDLGPREPRPRKQRQSMCRRAPTRVQSRRTPARRAASVRGSLDQWKTSQTVRCADNVRIVSPVHTGDNNYVEQHRAAPAPRAGFKAGDLPIEQATQFDLVINMKPAKGARPRRAADAPRPRRRGDRIIGRSAHAVLLHLLTTGCGTALKREHVRDDGEC
jgi:hypothetical protein